MVWVSGVLPYAEAAQVFARVGHLSIPASSLWRQTRLQGQRLHAIYTQHHTQVGMARVVLPPAGQDHASPKGVSLDGGTLNIRGEGWKEFKVGTVYDVVLRPSADPHTNETVELAAGANMDYCAVLGSVTEFAPALWYLAVHHDLPTAAEVSVTADGAEWIWNTASDLFPEAVQIVDWYHATQHLTQAAQALFPSDPPAAQRWEQARRNSLFLGEISAITDPLDTALHNSEAHYFHTHQRRMQYQTFREQGYPIGSGTVESGIKQFKHRLAGPGMRWSRVAAQEMLLIRACILSNTFDALWQASRN
jgi:hypothetical protein